MTSFDIDRRKILKAGGAGLVAGLAGCGGLLADGTGVPGKSPPVEEENGSGSNVPSEVDSALSDQGANLYQGELADHTGEDEVVIEVGAGDGGLAFNEPAVRVDPGTNVVWEWVDVSAGAHNVVHDAENKVFNSGSAVGEVGTEYEFTFENEGNFVYYCGPHQGVGMWGAIVVGGSSGGGSGAVDSYLSDNSAKLYDGSVTDMTGEDSITIGVGAGDGGLAFDPPAVSVSPGTEITWEWVDVSAGAHNVETNEGPTSFQSETIGEVGHTFTQTLEETGNYLYQCSPHQAVGMHGAVVVEE